MRDGTVMVEWIQQKTTQFNGKVEVMLPDEWTVSGIHLQITKNTRINGDPKIGAFVGIEAVQRVDHELVARSITIKTVWQDLLDLVPGRRFVDEMSTSEPEIQSSPGSEVSPVEVHQPSATPAGNGGEHGGQPGLRRLKRAAVGPEAIGRRPRRRRPALRRRRQVGDLGHRPEPPRRRRSWWDRTSTR